MGQNHGWLQAVGYPEGGVNRLRRRRLPIIIILAVLSWALFIGLGWLLVSAIF